MRFKKLISLLVNLKQQTQLDMTRVSLIWIKLQFKIIILQFERHHAEIAIGRLQAARDAVPAATIAGIDIPIRLTRPRSTVGVDVQCVQEQLRVVICRTQCTAHAENRYEKKYTCHHRGDEARHGNK